MSAVAHIGGNEDIFEIPSGFKGAVHFHIFAMKSKNWFYFTSLQISFPEHRHRIILIIFIPFQSEESLKLLTAFGAQGWFWRHFKLKLLLFPSIVFLICEDLCFFRDTSFARKIMPHFS